MHETLHFNLELLLEVIVEDAEDLNVAHLAGVETHEFNVQSEAVHFAADIVEEASHCHEGDASWPGVTLYPVYIDVC